MIPIGAAARLMSTAARSLTAFAVAASPAVAQEIRGIVFDEGSGAPVPSATVTLLAMASGEEPADFAAGPRTIGTATTDGAGRFSMDVDASASLVVVASAPGYAASPPRSVDPGAEAAPFVMLGVRRLPGFESRGAPSADSLAYVFGRVSQRIGTPVQDADILLDDGVVARRLTAGPYGRFEVEGLAPGPVHVRVEHLSFAPRDTVLDLEAGGAYEINIRLEEDPIPVAGIEVAVRSRSAARLLQPIYERMDRGLGGHFLTREDLESKGHAPVAEALNRLPSISIERYSGGFYRVMSRRVARVGGGGKECMLYVDGVPAYRSGQGGSDLYAMSTSQVEIVEFYPGAATVPPEYSRPGALCVVAIWTRRGG